MIEEDQSRNLMSDDNLPKKRLGNEGDCTNRDITQFSSTDTDNCVGSWCEYDSNCAASCCYRSMAITGPDQYYCTVQYCPNDCVDVFSGGIYKEWLCEGSTCVNNYDCAGSCCDGTCGGGTCQDTCNSWYEPFNTQTNICDKGGCSTDANCMVGNCIGGFCDDGIPDPPDPTNPSSHHGSDSLLWLWIILGIAGVGVILWAIYALMQSRKTD